MSKPTIRNALFIAVAAALCGSAQAASVNEVEVNHPITKAEHVSVPGDVSIAAWLGNGGTGDVDFYRFYATAGDNITLDIDNGWGGSGTVNVDTVMAVFDDTPAHNILRANDDAPTLDPGSTTRMDSRIDNFVAPVTGYYEVGVSNYGRSFLNGGLTTTGPARTGDYTLVISGVTDPVKQIAIDIKPGNNDIAPINPKSRGKIPVAILGGPDFNAMNIDPKTLTFGSTGNEVSLWKCDITGTDLNGDGRLDRLCHFNNQDAHFKLSDEEAILRGSTTDGVRFEGRGFLKVVPLKKPE